MPRDDLKEKHSAEELKNKKTIAAAVHEAEEIPAGYMIRSKDPKWYVVHTYSGHENKVKANLEHRRTSMHQEDRIRQIVVPTEQVVETKDGQKVTSERRVFPGYVLVQMELTDDT